VAGVVLEVIDDVLDDLQRFSRSGQFDLILKKLVQIESAPLLVGQPLGGDLATFRKLTFGNRNWRIIFRTAPDGASVSVWVIGDRDDMECYELAKQRVKALGDNPHRQTLEEAIEFFDRQRGKKDDTEAGSAPTS
jgi:mRNA interferase RelE/StbE